MRTLIGVGVVVLAVGCGTPLTCDPSFCQAHQTCAQSVVPTTQPICTCEPGFVEDWHQTRGCIPVVKRLVMNGRALTFTDVHVDRIHVTVPATTQTLDFELAADAFATVDGIGTSGKISRPFVLPATLVRIVFNDPAKTVLRTIDIVVTPDVTRSVRVAEIQENWFSSLAMSADGKVLAAGIPSYGEDCARTAVRVFDAPAAGSADAGWIVDNSVPGLGCVGRALSFSGDGAVLADVDGMATGAAHLTVWRRTDGAWHVEPLLYDQRGQDVAVAPEGDRIWIARDDPAEPASLGLVRDGGFWVTEVELSRGQAIATSRGSALVAVGSYERNTVAVFARGPQGYALREVLKETRGFGAALAFSADGSRLLVGAREAPKTARLYARTDAGFALELELPAPLDPGRVDPLRFMLPEISVALSADGTTAAVGFPADNSVAIATRDGGQWQVDEVLLPTQEEAARGARFGTAVRLSADGKRLAASCHACIPGLTVYERP